MHCKRVILLEITLSMFTNVYVVRLIECNSLNDQYLSNQQ